MKPKIMIIFNFTFLLAFNTESEEFQEKKNKPNEDDKQTPTDDENNEKDYELKPGDYIASLRIEYELLPKKFKYSIDLTCWRNLTKVSNSETYRYYRTLQMGNLLWVPVTIHHFSKALTEDDLVNLHSHIINFSVNTVKRDIAFKFSRLYCLDNEAKSERFVEYFEVDPNKQGKNNERVDEMKEFRQLSKKCEKFDCITSWLRFTGKTHCQVVYETISSVKKGNEIKHKEFIAPIDLPMGSKTAFKSKIKKQEENKKEPYFIIPGEVFFTDPTLAVYRLKEENKLLSLGYVLLSVENLMTREQKTSLNPFIVKIRKLDCIPSELLKQYGYKEIFVSFDIPFLAKYDSPKKPIGRTIYFNESHAYLTKNLCKYKYLEFLRTERVKVHIKGVREDENQIQPALFGTKKGDENFSKRMQPRQAFQFLRKKETSSNVQTLAFANYDISSLLKDVWFFRQQASCYHPDNLLHGVGRNAPIKLVDIITTPEINLAYIDNEKSASPLFDGVLASELTSLDMEFYFLAPLSAHQHLHNIKSSFKRFFITFYDLVRAQGLLASILQHNENIIGFNAVVIDPVNFMDDKLKIQLRKRSSTKEEESFDESMEDELKEMVDEVNDVITGFMIDNGAEIHIFVEGFSHGYILEVWNKIHKSNTSVAKVFLNSETEFENRMYGAFMIVGIYPITLKKPLQRIFQEQEIYVQGMIPVPCSKALYKLDLLLRTETLREMLKQELFPTGIELISLNTEFGVPLKMKT